jgi:hypothetical protein
MESLLKIGAAGAIATLLTIGSAQVSAAEDSTSMDDVFGYVGASYGEGKLEFGDMSEWDSAWKVFGGVTFNENIGAELTYADLGSPDGAGIEVDEATVTSLQVVGVLPLGNFDLFGKIGYGYYDAEFSFPGGGSPTRNGFDMASGFGVRYNMGNFGIRAEAEGVDVDFGDVYLVSLGLQFKF